MIIHMALGNVLHILEEDEWSNLAFEVEQPAILAFDQSSNITGLAYGTRDEGLVLPLALKRQHSKEPTVASYKEKVMEFLKLFMKNKNITNIECEQIYSKSQYYNSFEVLAQIKGMFQDLELQLGYNIPLNFRHVSAWRSKFCTTKRGNLHDKDDVVDEVLRRHPELRFLDMPVDTHEAIGILYAYIDHFAPKVLTTPKGNTIPIQQVHRTMEREKRHKNTIRGFSSGNFEELMSYIRNDPDLKFIMDYRGIGIFKFENSLTLEENVRALTSNSNKLWIGEVPQSSIYFSSVLWKYGINWREGQSIWVACYRNKKTIERIAVG